MADDLREGGLKTARREPEDDRVTYGRPDDHQQRSVEALRQAPAGTGLVPVHVLMVVSNPVKFDPRVLNEAKSLVGHGHQVTVIGWDRENEFPLSERTDGVQVLRVRNTPWMRLLPWDLLRLRPWWRLAYRQALAVHREARIDVVHCHDLDTLPTGVWLKRRLGVPLVYDAHEIWGYMVAGDLPAFVANHFLRKERRVLRHVDALILVSEPQKAYFEPLTQAPTTLVLNAKPLVTQEYIPPNNETFTLVSIGTLNEARFLLELVEIVAGLEGTKLVLAGIGKPAYVRQLEERSAASPNVTFLGRLPAEEVLPRTLAADAVVCLTDPADPNNSIATANKQFEAMVTGRPILVSKGTNLEKLTERLGVGLGVGHTREGVRAGIVRLRDNPEERVAMGRKGLAAALEEYNWTRQEQALLGVYEGLN